MNPQPYYNATQLEGISTTFSNHYRDMHNQDIRTSLIIPWKLWESKVFATGIDGSDLRIRFYHALDEGNKWNVACKRVKKINGAWEDEAFFVLLTENGPIDLSGEEMPAVVNDYWERMRYLTNDEWNILVPSLCVLDCIQDWSRLLELYEDNQDEHRDPHLFEIVFKPVSSDYSAYPQWSNVSYPHSLVAYMRYDGTDCLSNDDYGNLRNKAANELRLNPPG